MTSQVTLFDGGSEAKGRVNEGFCMAPAMEWEVHDGGVTRVQSTSVLQLEVMLVAEVAAAIGDVQVVSALPCLALAIADTWPSCRFCEVFLTIPTHSLSIKSTRDHFICN